MSVDQALLQQLIFGRGRFTQDSPVLPNVWLEYGKLTYNAPEQVQRVDLLLTPHRQATAGQLARAVRQRLTALGDPDDGPPYRELAYTESYVVGRFTFHELFCVLLPLTEWWSHKDPLWGALWSETLPSASALDALRQPMEKDLEREIHSKPTAPGVTAHLLWLSRMAGILDAARLGPSRVDWDKYATEEQVRKNTASSLAGAFLELAKGALQQVEAPRVEGEQSPLWLVNVNRPGSLAVARSRETVKTDVVENAFHPDLTGIRWAVLDSGIDATHPAFRKRLASGDPASEPFVQQRGRWANNTRIVETYDFTRIRSLLAAAAGDNTELEVNQEQREQLERLQPSLRFGRAIDWELLRPLFQVLHKNDGHEDDYPVPTNGHGTHVAGILAADWRSRDDPPVPEQADLRGICPTLELYDFRVLNGEAGADEFSVIAALSFLRFLNAHANQPVVHGVNVSISMLGDVGSYACGRTPVCQECERVVNSGVVVVVAAGNTGYQNFLTTQAVGVAATAGYQDISITDPGNAEAVITVGATHRVQPHTYGVSYFSSRGPTADGRRKPDLVAPGEKIVGPIPDGRTGPMDGTSMAAPHVSGAAALLMARHRELIGRPTEIKAILMKTATDLGRDSYFQGAGLLDIFRALQAV